MRDRLWGGGTFVDCDLGINSAVRQVRAALGDDAEKPRFIATLPAQRLPVHRAFGRRRSRRAVELAEDLEPHRRNEAEGWY